jgi:hypothetical protein
MLGSRLPKNRKFSIETRYYDPKKEEKEGRRIKFKRTLTRKRAKSRSLVWLVMLLAIVFYILYLLNRAIKP